MKYTTYKSAYYSTTTSYAQYLATLQPGCGHGQPVDAEEWDTVAAVTRSKAQKGLANHGVGQRYQAKITSIGEWRPAARALSSLCFGMPRLLPLSLLAEQKHARHKRVIDVLRTQGQTSR
eukprot:SAG11_NODE_305_length_10996_cov_4.698082_11_plen_120_part_00